MRRYVRSRVPFGNLADQSQRSLAGNRYIKNYDFDFDFGPPWGRCGVTMTSVLGHMTNLGFESAFMKDWKHPPPDRLFDARVQISVTEVLLLQSHSIM